MIICDSIRLFVALLILSQVDCAPTNNNSGVAIADWASNVLHQSAQIWNRTTICLQDNNLAVYLNNPHDNKTEHLDFDFTDDVTDFQYVVYFSEGLEPPSDCEEIFGQGTSNNQSSRQVRRESDTRMGEISGLLERYSEYPTPDGSGELLGKRESYVEVHAYFNRKKLCPKEFSFSSAAFWTGSIGVCYTLWDNYSKSTWFHNARCTHKRKVHT